MNYELIGCLEHVSLPLLKLQNIKAKIDTGADTSALHAKDIEYTFLDHQKYVNFTFTHDDGQQHQLQALFLEERTVKSSSGEVTVRPIVKLLISIGAHEFETEFSLINRNKMNYRMLIGRNTLGHRFAVVPSQSFLLQEG